MKAPVLKEMARQEALDGVVIAAPTHLHLALTQAGHWLRPLKVQLRTLEPRIHIMFCVAIVLMTMDVRLVRTLEGDVSLFLAISAAPLPSGMRRRCGATTARGQRRSLQSMGEGDVFDVKPICLQVGPVFWNTACARQKDKFQPRVLLALGLVQDEGAVLPQSLRFPKLHSAAHSFYQAERPWGVIWKLVNITFDATVSGAGV